MANESRIQATLKELEGAQAAAGAGTSLVTLALPAGGDLVTYRRRMAAEVASASNIQSRS